MKEQIYQIRIPICIRSGTIPFIWGLHAVLVLPKAVTEVRTDPREDPGDHEREESQHERAGPYCVNLASKECSICISGYLLDHVRFITCVFGDVFIGKSVDGYISCRII